MSKYLLDTHILLWSLLNPTRLRRPVVDALEDTTNKLWLSPISTWEILILSEKGRIDLDAPAAEWMRQVFESIPFHEAPLTHEVALHSRQVQLPHQDPADRFIVASAIVYGLTLITADRNLIQENSGYTTLPN